MQASRYLHRITPSVNKSEPFSNLLRLEPLKICKINLNFLVNTLDKQGMNITGVKGLDRAAIATLKAIGAVEDIGGASYSRRPMQRGGGASASLPRFGISAVIDVLSLLTIAIVAKFHGE
jgi:hypothetical protein